MLNDLRYAFRQLWNNPGFTAVAVLTLAFGIGANTAIFSFVNSILLQPLPYHDPDRLVMVFENHVTNGWKKNTVGAPVLAEWRQQSTVFEGLAARGWSTFNITGLGQPENVQGAQLSANIFSLLRVAPLLGRAFLPENETYGQHRVVLLSYEWWRDRFGGDSNVIGRTLTINAEPYAIVGVMPARTGFPEPNTKLWVPLAFNPEQQSQRHAHNYLVYGRLKPSASLAKARTEMDLIAQRMAESDPQNRGWGAEVHSLHEIMVGDSRRLLFVLLGAVGFVLLIACANIANLLLARAASRTREFAVRAALGAERLRIVRQLLTESLLLAAVGGVLGTFFAWAGLSLLVRVAQTELPRVWEGVGLNLQTLAFTMAVTLASGLIFGLAPILQFSRAALARDLNEIGRGNSTGKTRQRLRAGLVVAEVALSVMLLISAGLMVRSFERLISQELGFKPEHVVTMGVGLPNRRYPELADRTRFYEQLLAQVQQMPKVTAASWVLGLPLSGQNSALSVQIPDAAPPSPGEAVSAGYAQVSPGYFSSLRIPLLQGRDFTEHDRTNTPAVVIVDERFVRNFKLGPRPLGRRIGIGDGTESAEIIGVVKDTKRLGMADAPRGEMYRTYKQRCWGYLTLVVRTPREPDELVRAVRAELDKIDSDQPLENVRTMTQVVASSVAQRRLSMQLFGAFAAAALGLAALGLYGVLGYNVVQRTPEIGIRMALGAQRRDVLRLILGQGVWLAATGIGIGLMGALAAVGVIRGLLFGVEPADPLTFGVVPLVLAAVALVACYLPARRAAAMDPIQALRYD